MDAIDRIEILKEHEGLSRPKMAQKCGIEVERFKNSLMRKQKLYQEDMEAITSTWPEYAYWLSTGQELPEAGQLSPMTKKAQRQLKKTP